MDPIATYILAGGRSSRLGRDKARAMIGGEPLLAWVAREHAAWASPLVVVGEHAGQYDDLGLRTIADLRPACGPLGGLQSALADRPQPGWILLASCDCLGLQATWIEELWARRGESAIEELWARRGESAQVIAYRGERWQTLPALYHTALCSEVQSRLMAGAWSLWRLIENVPALPLPLPGDWQRVAHLTYADDLARLEALLLGRRPRSA